MWQFSPPTRFGSRYKDDIVKATNIDLYTYANATILNANENVNNIEEIIVKNYTGKSHKVNAKYIILACGGIQNARLLLASNNRISKGLENYHYNVGRYFMEHLEMKSVELWLSKKLPMDLYMIKYGETKFRAELAISETAQRDSRILNGTASLSPLANGRHFSSKIESWTSENPEDNKGSDFFERVGNKLLRLNESRIENAYLLETRLEQAPNTNSSIILDNEIDSLGVPKSKLHWKLSSLEKYSMRKMYEIIGQEVGYSELGCV